MADPVDSYLSDLRSGVGALQAFRNFTTSLTLENVATTIRPENVLSNIGGKIGGAVAAPFVNAAKKSGIQVATVAVGAALIAFGLYGIVFPGSGPADIARGLIAKGLP